MKPYGDGKPINYDPALRELWKNIALQFQWFNEYPMLFDKDDLILAMSQSKNHFFEWLGAIQIYKDLGYMCLVEKYQFKKHASQQEIFMSIIPKDIFDLIKSDNFEGRQAPDLFAYSQDKSDWFFCEVKGETDSVHKGQEKAFEKLERASC